MFPPKTTEEGAIYSINNGIGSCYHYTALLYELVDYLGYSSIPIIGIGPSGFEHSWLAVKYSDGWYYLDPLYRNSRYSHSELTALGYEWDFSEALSI